MAESPQRRIGVISDTHGLLRPQALDALQGSDHIIHAGDIVEPAILDELSAIATLTCVRGNNDRGPWAAALPETAIVEEACVRILVIHDLKQLRINARAAGLTAVVSGHSHRPRVDRRDGVLYVNPGSAGPRRFKLPVSVARLLIHRGQVEAELIELAV
jgi:uncharacterized protein